MSTSNNLTNLTVQNAPVSNTAAAADNELLRLGEARALMATLLQGAWSGSTTYAAGQLVTYGGALWLSRQAANLNHAPVAGSWWTLMLGGGTNGTSAYVYVAYASDGSGTGFSLSPGSGLYFMAVKVSATVISSPQAGDFAGLWTNLRGPTGAKGDTGAAGAKGDKGDTGNAGADGAAGAAGTAACIYVAYASDTGGTGFSLTPASGLPYMAVKVSSTVISSPQASDFAGLWVKFCGSDGVTGAAGPKGDAGASAYLYLAFASDTSGTGFSLTPGPGLYCVAAKAANTAISSPSAGDFTGLWLNLRGPAGAAGSNGTNGTNGASVYGYVAYASDASGAGFSLTPGSGLNFIALKLSATAISAPAAGDFAGLWKQYAVTPGAAVPASTDDLAEGLTNLYFSGLRVLATALTAVNGTAAGDVVAGDSLVNALSKLQNRLKTVENNLGLVTYAEGDVPLAQGVGTGNVSGLALAFTPTKIFLTLQLPTDGQFLSVACLGAPTTDGFNWVLSANTDKPTYKLHYRLAA